MRLRRHLCRKQPARARAAELLELGAGATELVLKVLQHLARPLALRVLGGAHLVRQVSISATHRAQLARRREHCGGLLNWRERGAGAFRRCRIKQFFCAKMKEQPLQWQSDTKQLGASRASEPCIDK